MIVYISGGITMTLDKLAVGKSASVKSVDCKSPELKQHMLDMGLTPGTAIKLIKTAPMGDPMEIRIRGYELTVRKEEAAQIVIEEIRSVPSEKNFKKLKDVAHPQHGEMGKYHTRVKGEKLSDDEVITFALAGNQNCGKTTLFNVLTGSNQHVGNFPGVTVDRKDGVIKGIQNSLITDLPGIYSLSPYSSEEDVTRKFLLKNRPKGIINILDATNMERNLYLTMQLMELEIPMVIALNMMDEVRQNGGAIMVNKLEEMLGVPVIPISASKKEGISELIEHAVHVAKFRERPGRIDFCDENDGKNGAVHRCIHAIAHLIKDHSEKYKIPVRFAAAKIAEGDKMIADALKLSENELETIRHIIAEMEAECGKEAMAALADMRFSFIEKVCSLTVVKPHESREHIRSVKIDRVLTGKYTAIPSFVLIMAAIFYLTFSVFGKFLSAVMDIGIDKITALCDSALTSYGINPVIHSLIINGIFAGVGSVLSFLPIIVVLFFFLSVLEDSGYMARVAFVMDKFLRKIGLSGRSFVPMLIGFGCSVPAIMSTRTIPSNRDRRMTILLTPFMSCSAKLPIYAMFTAAFFPQNTSAVMVGLYFTGIIVAVIFALCLKDTAFKGDPVPFVMELPNYRMPGAVNVLKLIGEKAKDFITKAFTIIFLASVIIWFLQTFDTRLNVCAKSEDSLLAILGSAVAPIFKPLGFADWRISTSLITGFAAKESVVSTLTVLLGGDTSLLPTLFTKSTAAVFLVFSLLYTPCVAAIAAVKNELGAKWAVSVCITQCVIAWIVAFFVHTALLFI